MLAVVINTCAGSSDLEVLARRGSFDNPGKHPYAMRAAKLEEMLWRYDRLDRVIVVGEWDYGYDYLYVHSPGATKSPIDPLLQRHAAVMEFDADFYVFLNDDHYIRPQDLERLQKLQPEGAVAFGRAVFINNTAHKRDTGWPGYIMGHACGLSRAALQAVPWNTVPATANWDVEHTTLLRAANVGITHLPDIIAWDIEEGEAP